MKNGKIIGLAWEQTFQQAFHKCQEYVFIWREESQQPNLHNTFFYETVATCQLFFRCASISVTKSSQAKITKIIEITKITQNHKK